MGKSVLLAEFKERALSADWAAGVVELRPSDNTDSGIARTVSALAKQIGIEVSKIAQIKESLGKVVTSLAKVKVTWNDLTFSLDVHGDGVEAIGKVLFDLCAGVVENGRRGVLLLVDEAQEIRDQKDRKGEHPLSLLISAVAGLQKADLPIGIVLCGLPTLTGNLLLARSYTERMFRGEEIGTLAPHEAHQALAEPLKGSRISMPDNMVTRVVEEVEGYPYFVQLWGAELWDAAYQAGATDITPEVLLATQPDIYRRLDIDFYEPRVMTLTPAEQDLLLATSGTDTYPPLTVSELGDVSDKTPGNINVLLGRLGERGVLYRIQKGKYEYTAPKFREYLQRRSTRRSFP